MVKFFCIRIGKFACLLQKYVTLTMDSWKELCLSILIDMSTCALRQMVSQEATEAGASTGIALHPYGRTTHALPAGDMHQHKGVSGNGTHPGLGMGKAQISFWMDHEAVCAAAVYCVLTLVTVCLTVWTASGPQPRNFSDLSLHHFHRVKKKRVVKQKIRVVRYPHPHPHPHAKETQRGTLLSSDALHEPTQLLTHPRACGSALQLSM